MILFRILHPFIVNQAPLGSPALTVPSSVETSSSDTTGLLSPPDCSVAIWLKILSLPYSAAYRKQQPSCGLGWLFAENQQYQRSL